MQDDLANQIIVGCWESISASKKIIELSTITPLVKRLEAADFVDRRRNPADERQVEVRLSNKGSLLRQQAHRLNDILQRRSGLKANELSDCSTHYGPYTTAFLRRNNL